MTISGLTIVRNAIENGYPIAEVIDCLRVICDEIVVLDGHSVDGTYEYLCTQNDIKLFRDKWNLNGTNGLEFARITNMGLERCKCDHIFYLQADELLHYDDIIRIPDMLDGYNSISFNFMHIRYDFAYKLDSGYDRAIRVIKNNKMIHSHYDAFTFAGDVHPINNSSISVYHTGYVFIRNILNKMVNHSRYFYVNQTPQLNRKELAEKFLHMLDNGESIPSNLDIARILEPEYGLIEHMTEVPKCLDRLIGVTEYTLPPQGMLL